MVVLNLLGLFKLHNRITIDVDTYDFYVMIRKLIFGLKLLRCKRFDVDVSSSKNGYHIIFYRNMPICLVLLFRFVIGDDKRRLWFDMVRVLLGETLIFDLLFDRYRYRKRRYWKKKVRITNLCRQYVYKFERTLITCQKPQVKRKRKMMNVELWKLLIDCLYVLSAYFLYKRYKNDSILLEELSWKKFKELMKSDYI